MSSALAIAGVTAVLKDLLNDGLIQHNAAGELGSSVTVSVGPPDRIAPREGHEASQLNVFLYLVTPNAGWRNEGLPSHDGRQRLTNAPLALDLHYLISACSSSDFHGEILLGYALQLLHENAMLPRQAIRRSLTPAPELGDVLPPALRALATTGLDSQAEQIKISPAALSTEELCRLWSATQSPMRPSAACRVSVVLITANEPARSPLPVLSVGPLIDDGPLGLRSSGVALQTGVIPALPTLETAEPAEARSAAQIGSPVTLSGHHLASAAPVTVRLVEAGLGIDETLAASAGQDPATELLFTIPESRSADFPVGLYSLSVRLTPPGSGVERETNSLGLSLAPTIVSLPQSVSREADGSARIALEVRPTIRASQNVTLILGEREFTLPPRSAPTTQLSIALPDAPPGSHLVRLKVDGIASAIVERSRSASVFTALRLDIL